MKNFLGTITWYMIYIIAVLMWMGVTQPNSRLAAQEIDSKMKVTVLAFSGIPNPVFYLNNDEIVVLKDKLGQIPEKADMSIPEFPYWPAPGIAGFQLHNQGAAGLPDNFYVFNDVITIHYPHGDILLEDNGGINAWLVSLAKEKVIDAVPLERLNSYLDGTDLESQINYQAAYVMARNIEKENINIVVATVTSTRDIILSENELNNTFQLVNLEVVETIHGNVDNSIYAVFSKNLIQNLRYKGFQPDVSGSKWILFLESAFSDDNPVEQEIINEIQSLETGIVLSSANLFTIHYYGYGILCLDWPTSRAKPINIPMAAPEVINDIKSVLELRSEMTDVKDDANIKKQLIDKMQTEFGKALGKKYFEDN